MSRFVVVSNGSQLRATARSSVHPFTYSAPLSGEIEADIVDGQIDVAAPITGLLDLELDLLRGDDPRADREMQRRLDTHRYPHAKAAVNNVQSSADDDIYLLSGDLTLHGQTRPLEGWATVTLNGDQLHATGSLTIDVREFGIKPPSLLVLRVHPEIEITIDLVAAAT